MRLARGMVPALLLVAGGLLAAAAWSGSRPSSWPGSWAAALLPDGASTGGAVAAGGAADLSGRAALGPAERAVTLRLACDPAGPGLSAVLTVPDFADLAPRFDFAGLEGPGGAPLTGIVVSGAGGVRGVRAAARGAAAGPAGSFALTVAGARRGEDPLRGIAPAMTEAGARITWTQASPRPGDAPLAATFAVGDAPALKAALGSCLVR